MFLEKNPISQKIIAQPCTFKIKRLSLHAHFNNVKNYVFRF